jgi:hypothetical protein
MSFFSVVKLFQQIFLLYLWLLQSYFISLAYLEIFKPSTCILVWGIIVLWFTDIFSCVRLVNIWIIYWNFSIIACYSSFIINNSNSKTVFYVTFKCKLWTTVIRLNTKICNGNIFQSSLPNLNCPKCLWILNFSTYDIIYSHNGPVHFSKGILDWLIDWDFRLSYWRKRRWLFWDIVPCCLE